MFTTAIIIYLSFYSVEKCMLFLHMLIESEAALNGHFKEFDFGTCACWHGGKRKME